ncbi:MAG: DUF1559 domain-containing protein [Pirellula sp.]|jgi:beta-lactamase regulating signal transducer with metallopeptidase domain|nr:DUF1559 domain-containing protein [Pirellula sp.]
MKFPYQWPEYIDAQLIVWTVFQITIVALVSYALVRIASTHTPPKMRATIAILGLICLTALSFAGMTRMYEWSWGDWIARSLSSKRETLPTRTSTGLGLPSTAEDNEATQPVTHTWWDQALINANELFMRSPLPPKLSSDQFSTEQDETPNYARRSTWFWFSSILILSVFLGFARVIVGFWLVQHLRRGSVPLEDPQLHAEIDECAKELGATHGIPIAVSNSIGSPAVVGWLHPLLLLPKNWQTWTPEERRAVLAHELAHVVRNDYLITSFAQLVAAVHFYHPVVHALVSRLRLDQELSADLMASRLVGGSQRYIEIVAGLALRQPVVRAPGPAQAFLPTRQMFVRRLEMLRFQSFSSRRWGRCYMVAGAFAIISLTFIASGLRPVVGFAEPAVSTGLKGVPAESQQADLLSLIPAEAIEGVADVDVSKILALPAIQKLISTYPDIVKSIPFDPKSLERAVFLVPQLSSGKDTPLLILRFTESVELAIPESRRINDRTYVIGGTEDLRSKVGDSPKDESFKTLLARHDGEPVRIAGKMKGIRQVMTAPGKKADPSTMAFAPLWNNVDTVSIGLSVDKDLRLDARMNTNDAKRVAATLSALKNLGDNLLATAETSASQGTKNDSTKDPISEVLVKQGKLLMQSVVIKTNENYVQISARVDSFEEAAVAFIAPAVQSARMAALRTQSANNLKQIMIALHSYETANNYLPSAIVRDPKSGMERSWRVEILPYLNRQDLYDLYRKDEPWDSIANQEVLKKMPAVFVFPGTMGTDTPYLAIASPDGGLTPTKDGKAPRFQDATDGFNSTVFVVETNPMVPWTKPVDATDLEAIRKTPLHNGLGFHVGLGDGAVVFIANSIDPLVWKALSTRSGGEISTSK